jgi:4-hydroxybenzoate polyprenyltransferase
MTGRLRVLAQLSRPGVMMLLAIYAALGLAQGGASDDLFAFAKVLSVVAGFLVYSVVCNDIADEAIDRVNLPNGTGRPLVAGTGTKRDLIVVGGLAVLIATGASLASHWAVTVVLVSGLILSTSYSLRPTRLADRGAVASLILPAGYVAVPYLAGLLSATSMVTTADLALLGGLYVGFIGRILLKDFRDVRGDALFGKRTFLVRHGRRWTCALSAVCWALGATMIVASLEKPSVVIVLIYSAAVAFVLLLLRGLAVDAGPRRDEAIIAATAITGRGMVIVLLAHLSMTHWQPAGYHALMVALAVLVAGRSWSMLRHGPSTRMVVPANLAAQESIVGAKGAAASEGTR